MLPEGLWERPAVPYGALPPLLWSATAWCWVLVSQGRDMVLEAAVLDAQWSCSRDRDTQAGH